MCTKLVAVSLIYYLYGMHPVVCHLRKDIIWDSRATNNKKETKQTLLCQHLFLFVVGDPFLGHFQAYTNTI
jgi:hypothetical protein